MAPRLKALEGAHKAWLLSEAQKNGRLPLPEEDKFLTPDTPTFLCSCEVPVAVDGILDRDPAPSNGPRVYYSTIRD